MCERCSELEEERHVMLAMSVEDAAAVKALKEEVAQLEQEVRQARSDHRAAAETSVLLQQEIEALKLENRQICVGAVDQVEAAQQEAQHEIKLLRAQSEEDMQTIAKLQTDLHEALLSRDQFEQKLASVTSECEEAVQMQRMVEAHAEQLRESNTTLAGQKEEMADQLQSMAEKLFALEQFCQLRPSSMQTSATDRVFRSGGSEFSTDLGRTDPALVPVSGTSFKTVRQLRSSQSQHDGEWARPLTSPLEVEAIYGEKVDEDGEKLYYVKFVAVATEQWTRASELPGDSRAIRRWKQSRAHDASAVNFVDEDQPHQDSLVLDE